jgi:hypothetical protein
MVRDVAVGPLGLRHGRLLNIHWNRDVRYAAARKRGAAGQCDDVFDMGWTHHACGVLGHVGKDLGVVDVLLRESVVEILVRQTGDGDHRGAVESSGA